MSQRSRSLDVAILGGGISGLTVATHLQREGWRVAVLEQSGRAGGCIRTWKSDDFLFELGPNTVLDNAPEIAELCDLVGLASDRQEAQPLAKKRFVVKRGRLVALPSGPSGLVTTSLLSWRAKLRLLREPFLRPAPSTEEESIAQFTRRRLGAEILDYAIGPFVSGVYAGDPERLSVSHATAKIHALEQRHGSLIRGAIARKKEGASPARLFTFRGGLETLPKRLAAQIDEGWQPGTRVIGVRPHGDHYQVVSEHGGQETEWQARAVVVALPAAPAATVLRPLGGGFVSALRSLPHADVAVVSLGFRRDQVAHPLDGFGFLAPEKENRHVLGCLFPSSIFQGRAAADHVALSAFVGGALHKARVSEDSQSIVDATVEDLAPLLGLGGAPVVQAVERWCPAIPQYVVGHGDRKAEAAALEQANPGVFLSGNFLHGVSVADCIRNATELSLRVGQYLRPSTATGRDS